ncbi:MAG TPA: SDR family oxidoreductase [Candidatus Dormibacteraeota bacterium]|nr:SDR family oxidoreductase [Candidatus Dormibacteraeota bacterium]
MSGWSGRVVAVTGGLSGMGRATAELLRGEGAEVAVIDRSRPSNDDALAASGALMLQADVSDEAQIAEAFAAIDSRFGRLNGLFSNAGIARPEALVHEETLAQWQEVISVNLTGTFLVVREAVRRMVAGGGGAIVCTSSAMGTLAIPGGTNAYTASKGAINALVRQVAVDYARQDVRINAIAPGAIDTPLMWATTPPNEVEQMRTTIDSEVPLGKIGRPLDIANAVVWLLSDAAAYVTGAVYHVDGGASARMILSV